METEYIEKLIEFACNRIMNDIKEGKFTAYFVAQEICVTRKSILHLVENGWEQARYSTITGLIEFYERHYGVISLPKTEEDYKL